jgi:hypothetical protein
MYISLTNTIGAIRTALGIVRKNLQLWLDFEKSEVIGSEEVVDGDFPTGTTAWDSTQAVFGDGEVSFSTSGSYAGISQANALEIGLVYNYSFEITSITGTIRYDNGGGGNEIDFITEGVKTGSFIASATTVEVKRASSSESSSVTITNISVKEVAQFAKDKSTNTNDAKLFTGKALSFNGNDSVDLGEFNLISDVATFSFWLNSNDTLGRVIDANPDRFIIGFAYNELSIYSSGWYHFGTITTGELHRVAVVLNGTSAKCYVDGVQLGNEKTIPAIDLSDTDDVILGANYGATDSFLDGTLSDFQIYNSAWTSSDVTFDYNNPNHLVTDNPNSTIALSNLKGYWALSEGSGSIAYDSSGEGNNGAITGATYDDQQPTIPQLGLMDWSKGSNLIEFSEDFSNSDWTKSNCSITANQSTSPLGGSDADLMVANTDDARLTTTTSLGGERTFSIYVKRASVGDVEGQIDFSGLGIVSFTATDEWQRVSSTLDNVGTFKARVRIDTDTESLYIWGAQLEQASTVGSYIGTNGSAASNATLVQNPNDLGKDVLGNSLRLREHAFNLDGSGYGEIADDGSLDYSVELTLECWIKTGGSDSLYGLITKYSPDIEWDLVLHNGKPRMALRGTSQIDDSGSGFSDLRDNQWHHIVKVCNTTSILSYLNGSLVNTKVGTWIANVSKTSPVLIGQRSGISDFDGLQDEARLYNRALTQKEITQNFKAGINKHKVGSSFSDDFSSDYGL